tara:strand:+ start:44 stop:577 length:534 start_codon:yes stop_codon:yes gene_type:complete
MKEEWILIKGSGVYYVSNTAKVRSITHDVRMINGRKRIQIGRELVQAKSRKGYLMVSVKIDGKKYHTSVHRLIALSFIPNPENKPQVNHIDGNKLNNVISNLEWCTNKENHDHARKMGLMKSNTCESHHMSKLTNEEVIIARIDHKKGASINELCERHDISIPAMHKIIKKQTYKEV